MRKLAYFIAMVALVLTCVDSVKAQETYNLFEATHYGHDMGNWNVGLWRHYGNGDQIPYRVTTPCGTFYAGGPVNKGGSGRVYWGAYGSDTHSFVISYDPATRQLDFVVVGLNTISESAESPRIDAQTFCDPPDTVTLFAGGEVGKVNNLLMVIQATAGTSVPTCGPSNWGCKNQQVNGSVTELSNLSLNGVPVSGAAVSADLADNPTATSFTNKMELNISVPDDAPWVLTGDLTVVFDAADLNFSPKQWRVGLTAYGQYIELPNQPPVADPGGPYLGAVNTAITFDGTGSSDPDGDPLSYAWTFGDGDIGTGDTPTHSYVSAGIYDVCLTVNDGTDDSDSACTIAVVYDPSAGFVTGGGWIDSPAGAYMPDPSLAGKANFGFVAKYKKGANVPDGQTEFVFKAGDLNFHSSNYDWLVVTGSNYAKFKGTGTINGSGEYRFMLWAGDGEPDTFRIRIWTEDEGGVETDVYDNGMDQPIGGGSIVVHTK